MKPQRKQEFSLEVSTPTTREEKGRTHAVVALYFCMGVGVLLPWNAFITAVDYFSDVYPDRHVDRLFSVSYLPATLVFLGLMIWAGDRLNTRARIAVAFVSFSAIMLLVPVLNATGSGIPSGGLTTTCLLLGLAGVMDGVSQGALYGEAAMLGPRFTQVMCGGTAASGVLVGILRIITKASTGDSSRSALRVSAAIYFIVGAVFCFGCAVAHGIWLPRQSLYRLMRAKQPEWGDADVRTYANPAAQVSGHSPTHSRAVSRSASADVAPEYAEYAAAPRALAPSALEVAMADQGATAASVPLYREVIPKMYLCAAAVLFVYVVTLAIFPGFLSEDVSSEDLGDWYPILLILLFNIGDLVGKLALPGLRLFSGLSQQHILAATALRLVFVPAFAVAASQGAGPAAIVPLTLALGLSNGGLTSVSMMTASMGLPVQEAEVAGEIMVFFLLGGLTIGAFAGWLWVL